MKLWSPATPQVPALDVAFLCPQTCDTRMRTWQPSSACSPSTQGLTLGSSNAGREGWGKQGVGRGRRWSEWAGPEEAAVCPDVTYLACTLPGLLAAHITKANVQWGILQSCGILFQRIECYVFRPIFFFFPNCIWNNPSGIMQVRLPVRANQKCEQVIYWWVKLGSHHGTISTNPWNLEANLT